MKMFKVLKGSPCEVIASADAKSFTDIGGKLTLKRCSCDKIFTREECIADFVSVFNDTRTIGNTVIFSSVERYVAGCSVPLYAFEYGGWIAIYRADDVEIV